MGTYIASPYLMRKIIGKCRKVYTIRKVQRRKENPTISEMVSVNILVELVPCITDQLYHTNAFIPIILLCELV